MSFIQVVSKTTTAGPTVTENITINSVTSGSLLVLVSKQQSNSRNITSIADTQSNVWAAATLKTGNDKGLVMWYAPNCGAGNTTLTITYNSSSTTNIRVHLLEYSGIAVIPLDVFDSDVTYAITGPTGPVTPTGSGAMVISAGFTEDEVNRPLSNTPAGYTLRVDDQISGNSAIRIGEKYITDTTNQSVSWDVSGGLGYVNAHIAVFNEASGVTVDSADDYGDDDATHTISGTNFDLIAGTLSVEINGVVASVNARTDTLITVNTIPIPASGSFPPYGTVTITIKEDGTPLGFTMCTHSPGSTEQYVVLASPGEDVKAHITAHFGLPLAIDNDQLYGDKLTSTGKAITYNADGSFSIADYNPSATETFNAGHIAIGSPTRYASALFTVSDGVISSSVSSITGCYVQL